MESEKLDQPAVQTAKFDFDILAPHKPAIFSGEIKQGEIRIASIIAWAANDDVLERTLFTAYQEVRKRRTGIVVPK